MDEALTKRLVGLDLGSTHLKAVVLHWGSGTIEQSLEMVTPRLSDPASGSDEIDAFQVLEGARSLLSRLGSGISLLGIGVTGQMHGALLVDDRGQPLGPFLGWQDRRAAQEAAELGLRPGHTLALLLQLKRSNPALVARARQVLNLCDFVAHNLQHPSMGCLPKIHVTQAAASGGLLPLGSAWNLELLRKFQISEFLFPEVTKEIVSGVSVGDQQASLLGAGMGLLSPDALNIGTGSQVVRLLPDGSSLPDPRGYELRPYFGSSWIATVPGLPGGKLLQEGSASVFADAFSRLPGKSDPSLPIHGAGNGLRFQDSIREALERALGRKIVFSPWVREGAVGAALTAAVAAGLSASPQEAARVFAANGARRQSNPRCPPKTIC